MTTNYQPKVLAPVSANGRFFTLQLRENISPRAAVERLALNFDPSHGVLGVGEPLARALGANVSGLRAFPMLDAKHIAIPSTQGALWISLSCDDASELHDRCWTLQRALEDTFVVDEEISAFKYHGGRDLSGYEDGTENPVDEAAIEAAIVTDGALAGASFVAVQRYVHDLKKLETFSPHERDNLIGRERESNEEMDDAPVSAHVKRAAQESFDPAAFMVRKSMPWGGAHENGLYFVAFGHSLDAFENVLRRMIGLEDGITDGLFQFSRAVTGGYYFCPPVKNGKLDLSAFGL